MDYKHHKIMSFIIVKRWLNKENEQFEIFVKTIRKYLKHAQELAVLQSDLQK